jgi:phosphoribosylpyrophosphate synthetase
MDVHAQAFRPATRVSRPQSRFRVRARQLCPSASIRRGVNSTTTLRSYKDGWTRQVRERSALLVAALLARFLFLHGTCIRDKYGDWDFLTSVPLSSGRAGIHPFEAALEWVPWLSQQHRRVLGRGAGAAAHNSASDDAFRAVADIRGTRVLLIDDTYTTGARAQSAASALTHAGGTCVAIVPVGRVINPQFADFVQEYWEAQRAIRFRFDVCCLEAQ